MMFAFDNSFLLLDQDSNRFLLPVELIGTHIVIHSMQPHLGYKFYYIIYDIIYLFIE